MRSLRAKDFLKIITGRDLEFRMNPYRFKLLEDVNLDNVEVIHDLEFGQCQFRKVTLNQVKLTGAISFTDSQLKCLEITQSDFREIKIKDARMNRLLVKGNTAIGSLWVNGSMINELEVSENQRFETLHIGCANEIQRAVLNSNGFHNGQGSSSQVYLCPERFNHLEVDRLNSGKVEFGTFGEFAHMRVNDVVASEVALENCCNEKSDVLFTNIRPNEEGGSRFKIANSNIGPAVLANSELKRFKHIQVENSSIAEELLMLNHINQRKRGNFSSKLASFLFFTW